MSDAERGAETTSKKSSKRKEAEKKRMKERKTERHKDRKRERERTNEEKTRWQIGASASQLIIYWTSGTHRTTHKEKMVHLLIRRHRMESEN